MKSLAGGIVAAACLFLLYSTHAADSDDKALSPGAVIRKAIADKRTGQFVPARFASSKGGSLPYQVFTPTNSTAGTRYPLLIFLHGAGDLGDDNLQQLSAFPREFISAGNQAQHPCYAIAPQCPTNDSWSSFPEYPTNAHASKLPTAATRIAKELIEELVADCNIDRSRIYVTGLSLGGESTFDIVSRRADLFAAAVPVCGIADVDRAASMKTVPFWIFHGEDDEINPARYSREIVQALKALGATPKYTEYQGEGPGIWNRAYTEPGLIPWIFQQHR
jgi:predicted peptidase